jgi:hypothetical protein
MTERHRCGRLPRAGAASRERARAWRVAPVPPWLAVAVLGLAVCASGGWAGTAQKVGLAVTYGRIPLHFERNPGSSCRC